MPTLRTVKKIITLGPATRSEEHLQKMKDLGVDFVRVNMSHSTLADLEYFIKLAKKVGIPFILDTDGSQIRIGRHRDGIAHFYPQDIVRIYGHSNMVSGKALTMRPTEVVKQLQVGDLVHIDFNTLILRIIDVSSRKKGYILSQPIRSGYSGNNKAVVIDPVIKQGLSLPPLSEKDGQAIVIGLRYGVQHIAVSYIREGGDIDIVKKATKSKMKIISKIECLDALQNLDEIIAKSDALLLDRGDLSKEIPIERIPFTQKEVIRQAAKTDTPVYIATNLLETMVEKPKPTRAEVNDIVNTILDGASGLALATETAIGKYPIESILMLNRLIAHTNQSSTHSSYPIVDIHSFSLLPPPHGGTLIDRTAANIPSRHILKNLPRIEIDDTDYMDIEQIAFGTFSPLEGFMNKKDFESVLKRMCLTSGTIWPLPIVLDVPEQTAKNLKIGHDIALTFHKKPVALLHLEEKYRFDRKDMAQQLYNTLDEQHPGVRLIKQMHPMLLAGKITLLERRPSQAQEYVLTPRQTRRLFDEMGWVKVVGFHTRNVIHHGHEFIQLTAMQKNHCDGLFIHPVIGKKKSGDYQEKYVLQSYKHMIRKFYPKGKVILAAFSTYSRYAGPREAIFTAICRKNFGCSHFIVGRDHTGVSNYYSPTASQKIFDKFPDIGIAIVKFDEVVYSKKHKTYIELNNRSKPKEKDILRISGTFVRSLFKKGNMPPSWYMRPEISKDIVTAIKNGEEVFVT